MARGRPLGKDRGAWQLMMTQSTPLPPKGAELVHDWALLVPDEQVFLRGHEAGSSLGSVDAVSEDGTILWLHLENGAGRRLFTRDSNDVWRLVPRDIE